MRQITVAVGVVTNAHSEVLLTRRAKDVHQGGLWEFPGGKLESTESVMEALVRELREELAIEVCEAVPLIVIEHDYGDLRVCLDVQRVLRFSGVPVACEGQPMRWVPLRELRDYEFPAANEPIVAALLEASTA